MPSRRKASAAPTRERFASLTAEVWRDLGELNQSAQVALAGAAAAQGAWSVIEQAIVAGLPASTAGAAMFQAMHHQLVEEPVIPGTMDAAAPTLARWCAAMSAAPAQMERAWESTVPAVTSSFTPPLWRIMSQHGGWQGAFSGRAGASLRGRLQRLPQQQLLAVLDALLPATCIEMPEFAATGKNDFRESLLAALINSRGDDVVAVTQWLLDRCGPVGHATAACYLELQVQPGHVISQSARRGAILLAAGAQIPAAIVHAWADSGAVAKLPKTNTEVRVPVACAVLWEYPKLLPAVAHALAHAGRPVDHVWSAGMLGGPWLQVAIAGGQLEVVDDLLRLGADPGLQVAGCSALDLVEGRLTEAIADDGASMSTISRALLGRDHAIKEAQDLRTKLQAATARHAVNATLAKDEQIRFAPTQ